MREAPPGTCGPAHLRTEVAGRIPSVSRQAWVMLGTLAVIGVIGIAVWNFDLASSTPAVERVPVKPLAEPVRDTSAPAVRAREGSPAPAKASTSAKATADKTAGTAAEPVPAAIVGSAAGEVFGHLVRMNEGLRHDAPKLALQRFLAGVDLGRVQDRTEILATAQAGQGPQHGSRGRCHFARACRLLSTARRAPRRLS